MPHHIEEPGARAKDRIGPAGYIVNRIATYWSTVAVRLLWHRASARPAAPSVDARLRASAPDHESALSLERMINTRLHSDLDECEVQLKIWKDRADRQTDEHSEQFDRMHSRAMAAEARATYAEQECLGLERDIEQRAQQSVELTSSRTLDRTTVPLVPHGIGALNRRLHADLVASEGWAAEAEKGVKNDVDPLLTNGLLGTTQPLASARRALASLQAYFKDVPDPARASFEAQLEEIGRALIVHHANGAL